MSLGVNLQFLRKKENMTQEQLAELLGVSRQSISKWESDASYPETDKIIQICDRFHCNMDTLMRGNLEDTVVEDTAKYDENMNRFSVMVAIGVGLIIMGAGMAGLLEGFMIAEAICDMVMLSFTAIAIFILIVFGVERSQFRKKNPCLKQFYTEEQIDAFNKKFPFIIGGGVTLIILAMIVNTGLEEITPPAGCTTELYDGIFMMMIAVAVGTLIYGGLQKSKYDIKAYNEENEKENSPENKRIGKWCGVVMLIATILFLVSIGFELGMCNWKIDNWSHTIMAYSWLVFPIGGIICGIIFLILSKTDSNGE